MIALKGVYVASVTPMRNGALDEEAVAKLTEYYIESGLQGMFFPSSSGEYFALTDEQRVQCVALAVRQSAGRAPVLANISEGSLQSAMGLACQMADAGADAVVMMPPSFHHHTQEELVTLFTMAADQSPLPLVIYNHLVRLPNRIEMPALLSLREHPNIVGVKDTHNDAARLLAMHARGVDGEGFSVLAGGDGMAGFSALLGMQMLNALCAVRPDLFLALYKAGGAHDIDVVSSLQSRVQTLTGLFTTLRGGKSSAALFSQAIKAALSQKGLCGTEAVQLGYPLEDTDWQAVQSLLDKV